MTEKLSSDSIDFIVKAGEFCKTINECRNLTKEDFTNAMLNLLPALYISMNSYQEAAEPEMDVVGSYLDEEEYNSTREAIAALMGEDDTYLETFMEDMKYSDTPIAATISEGLADIYQDMFNFITTVRESEGTLTHQAMDQMHENFALYWSKTLCNVMRPLNSLKYNI